MKFLNSKSDYFPVYAFVCLYFQDAFVCVKMCAAVCTDGWNRVCLYTEESYFMDREARLRPVCGYQHYHLQRLLLHTGDILYTLSHFSWTLCNYTFCKDLLKFIILNLQLN